MKKKLRKLKRNVKKHAENTSYYLVYRTLYVAGLTILIPMAFAFSIGEWKWYSRSFLFLFVSLFLIIFSFVGMLQRKRHRGETLKSFGRMTLIPGTIALALFIFGKEVLLRFFSIMPGFENVEHLLAFYLDVFIPRMGILLAGYILIGAVLYLIGTKIKK